jgi:hypothetical protein
VRHLRNDPARRLILPLAATAGLALALLIMRADARFAALGRRAAAELIAPRVRAGAHVWFAGSWGFHHYAERAGARCLSRTPPQPERGDYLVATRVGEGSGLVALVPRRRLVGVLGDATAGGRIMSRADDAGFYSNAWGELPWAWGSSDLERFELWQVE